MSRKLLVLALLASALAGSLFPQITAPLRSLVASLTGGRPQADDAAADRKDVEGLVTLTPEQVAAARIEVAPAGPGVLTRRIVVPAAVTPDPDRIGRVAAKVAGTVAELRKKLGDHVEKGEVIAVIDSREVADAKSEYLASLANFGLQEAIHQREKGLFDKKIIAEQLYLRTKMTFTEARLHLDLARQKLASLDLSDAEIIALPQQPVADLRRKEIRATITGRVIERRVSLGQPVGGEGQEKELYVLADLSVVESDLSVPVADLPLVREKQSVSLLTADGGIFPGRVVFVNGMLTQETRSGHVIATFDNKDFALRPGSLLTARIALAESRVGIRIPRAAIQMINGEAAVFVRVDAGFVKRKIEIGSSDDEAVEVVSGLAPREPIAVSNTFVLKSELVKNDISAG